MSLKKIIFLQSEQDFQTLVSTGSLTKDGKVLQYEPDTTDYRVKYTEPTIPVKGVQVAGTDLTPDANGKVNVPTATNSAPGVVTPNATYGIQVSGSGATLSITKASDAEIAAKANNYKPIVPANLQVAVDAGVKGSTNYTQITYYGVDDTTAHHAKLYIEEID